MKHCLVVLLWAMALLGVSANAQQFPMFFQTTSMGGSLAITTATPLPGGTVGSAYSQALTASGGTPPYTWSFSVAPTPNTGSWLQITSGGILQNNPTGPVYPTTAETESMTVLVTDSVSATASKAFTLVVSASGGETNIFNCTSLSSSCPSTSMAFANGSSGYTAGALNVPAGTNHVATGAWYPTQVNGTGGIDTTFSFKFGNLTSPQSNCINFSSFPCINGIAFVMQNSNSGVQYATCPSGGGFYGLRASADANIDGYGGYNSASQCPIGSSVAIKFEPAPTNSSNAGFYYVSSFACSGAVGAYANFGPVGALSPGQDVCPQGIDLYQSGETFQAHVTSDETNATLTLVLKDLGPVNAGAAYRATWPIDVVATIGSNNFWVGFTGGIGPNNNATQQVTFWTMNTGLYTRLATPTFGVTPGAYTGAQSVTLGNCGSPVACYYSTNGIPPSGSSNGTLYTGSAISVSSTEILSVTATQSGFTDSLTAQGNYAIQSGGSPYPINLASGLTTSLVQANGSASITGGGCQLVDAPSGGGQESGSCYFPVPVGVSTFTKSYTLTIGAGFANGAASCEYNGNALNSTATNVWSVNGPNVVGNASGFGIGGVTGGTGGQVTYLPNSVCIVWDSFNNEYGLYTNGAVVGSEIAVTGISLNVSAPITITETSNGTTLALSAHQGSNSLSHTFTVNVPSVVGASTAYTGFHAATGGHQGPHTISAWTMTP